MAAHWKECVSKAFRFKSCYEKADIYKTKIRQFLINSEEACLEVELPKMPKTIFHLLLELFATIFSSSSYH